MAILDQSDYSDDTGWTTNSTAGTVTFNQDDGDGRIYCRCATGTLNSNGLVRTTGIVVTTEQVIFFDYRIVDALNANGAINQPQTSTTFSSAGDGRGGIYNVNSGPWFQTDVGVRAAINNPTFSINTWYNVKIEPQGDGSVVCSEHVDDGTPADQVGSGDWTIIADTTFSTWTGQSFHIMHNNGQPTLDVSRYYYTDDGVFTPSGGETSYSYKTFIASGLG